MQQLVRLKINNFKYNTVEADYWDHFGMEADTNKQMIIKVYGVHIKE